MASSIKRPKVTQYVRNVGKSVAFASINAIKETTPGIESFIKDNNEVFTNIYVSVKNYRATLKKIDRDIRNSNLYKAIEYGAKNMIDDAKTGNFYRDRSAENNDEIMGFEDDIDEFNYEVTNENSEPVNNPIPPEKYLSDSFNEAIGAATTGNATAVAQGTDMIIRSTKASTTILSGQIERSTATLHSGLGAVHSSISRIGEFLNGPAMAHLENSRIYYDESLKIMKEQHAMTKEFLDMQKNLYKKQDTIHRTSKLDQSMGPDGSVDLKGYMSAVKSNITNMLDETGLGMLFMGTGINIPLMIASAPLKYLMDIVVDGIMPKNLKNSLKTFDNSITSLFSQFIAEANNVKDDFRKSDLANFLGNIFGISVENKKSINPSNYNKGVVPFDGITRKTIVEVIPGYLSRIESALTGSDERYFDPYKGVWKTSTEIEKDFDEEKIRAIQMGNSGIRIDTYDLIKYLKATDDNMAKEMERSIKYAMTKIFEDGGYFRPDIIKEYNNKADDKGRRIRHIADYSDAYKDYGFKNKAMFEMFLSSLSDDTFKGLASNNMRAMQSYSRNLEQHEQNGGAYNILYNGTFDETGRGRVVKKSPTSFNNMKNHNLLTLSRDENGRNIFYYLREILNKIDRRRSDNKGYTPPNNYSPIDGPTIISSSRESETSSESEDDSGSPDDDPWTRAQTKIEEEERKKKEEYNKKHKIGDWVKDKLNKSPIGRFFNKAISGVSEIFSNPLQYATDLLDKANENLFAMMFGNRDLTDENGKRIDNVLEYMINKIKDSFDELGKWIKTKLKSVIDPLWEKVKPKVQPVVDELKSMGKAASTRIKTGLNNTFGKAASSVIDTLPPEVVARLRRKEVVSADEIISNTVDDDGMGYTSIEGYNIKENPIKKVIRQFAEDGTEYTGQEDYLSKLKTINPIIPKSYTEDGIDEVNEEDYLNNSARGRVVTKRGLTMISPGEVIIPASFDKKKQDKMLALEKKDRSRILNHIDLNAKGNIDTEELKKQFESIYNENKGDNKKAKNIASSIVGAGAGLLLAGNPLLGALAGAGISILNNSQTLQNAVFGEEINGERQGGLISKKIQDTFKKYLPDMTDYGIAGGVLGLLTPFGPLGGAAIGAGIGYLKNSESFKKYIFGDEATGEEGFIKKESYEKFKAQIKKAAPRMLLGAGAGILAGPFGLLGNAAMGAGLGLITTTDQFHNFLFGNKEEGTAGVLDALKTGLLDPAKEKLLEVAADFKEYAKKNIIEPMKNFWHPVNQMLKNAIQNTGDKIKDHINDMFERTVGLPLHDFLQEKIFKPVGKIVFGILKAPLAVGKAIVAAPFKAAQGIGNTIRARQIRRGTAYDMSASERLAWRDQHNIRFNRFNSWKDKTRQQDEMISGMTEEQLKSISDNTRAGLDSYVTLQRRAGQAKKDISKEISGFFNSTDTEDGKNRFSRVNYKVVKELTAAAQSNNINSVNKYIDNIKGLNDKEKEDLKIRLKSKIEDANRANTIMDKAKNKTGELDEELSELVGHKIKGRRDRRKLYRSAEAELKARNKISERENESPEVNATNNFAQIYKDKTDNIIKQLLQANEYLKYLVDPDADKNNTTPPGDIDAKKKEALTTNDSSTSTAVESTDTAIELPDSITKTKDKKKSVFGSVNSFFRKFFNEDIDEDSKEAVEAVAKEQAQEQEEAEHLETSKQSVSILTKIKDALVGNKENGTNGFLGKLVTGLGKFGKFMGMAGLTLTGVSLFGHASEWFNTSIWPKLKVFLFGTTNDDGSTTGLVGAIGQKIRTFLNGEDGKSGLIGGIKKILLGEDGLLTKAGTWITNKLHKIRDWIEGEGGLTGILTNRVIPGFIKGLGYAVNNLVAPTVSLVIKALPPLLSGLGKSILEGIKTAIFNPSVPNVNITDSGASDSIDRTKDSINASIEASDNTGIVQSIKSAFADISIALSSTNNTSSGKNTDKNNIKASGISGILGATKRTNTVEYDEDGNINTDYVRWNTTDSLASKVSNSATRGLWKGLTGNSTKTIAASGAVMDAAKAVGNFVKPGIGGKIKAVGQGVKAGIKGITNILGNATKIGTSLNSAIRNIGYDGKYIAKNIVKNSTDDVAEATLKTGILSGVKNIFKEIGNSSIVSKIAKYASNMINKTVTEKAVKQVVEAIGQKLGNTLISKVAKASLKGLANVIAKFSPLSLITFAADFIWGFNNAYTILGVANDGSFNVNLGLKCLCGLTNMITQFFTLGFIPADTIMDIIADYLFPLFGIDAEEWNNARNSTKSNIDDWNLENPDNTVDNLEDYNNRNKWWYKLKKTLSTADGKNSVAESIARTISSNPDNTVITNVNVDPNDPVNNIITDGIMNAYNSIGNGISYTTDRIKDGITNFTTSAKSIPTVLKTGIDKTFELANSGSINGIIYDLPNSTGNPVADGVANTLFGITKVFTSPIALAMAGFTTIRSKLNTVISKWAIAKSTKRSDDTKIQNALDGKLSIFSSNYWKNADHSKEGLFGTIANVQTYIEKILNAPVAMIMNITESIVNSFARIKDWFGDTAENVWDWFTGFFSGEDNSSKDKPKSNSGRGRSSKYITNTHAYQSSDTLSNIPYGDSTIGESGCAPVAAANILNSINRSNATAGVMDAAKYAEKHGMTVPGGGTDINYFNSYLESKGISTSNTANKGHIMNALREGNQVVMLGQDDNDEYGVPFGTTPHYITAKGISENGKIIAEDPDLPQNYIEYNPNDVMKSMITSVITDTKTKYNGKSRRNIRKNILRYGRSHNTINAMTIDGTSGSSTSKTKTDTNSKVNISKLTAQAVVNVARSQLGMCENGPNMIKYNDAYYNKHIVNNSQGSYQWCCVFVWWVFNQAGASKLFRNGAKENNCECLRKYYMSVNKYDRTAKIGDIVFFNFDGGSTAQHVGIVVGFGSNNNVITIEGNTGGNETNGGYVLEKNRNINCILGFAHPDYPYFYHSSTVVDMSKWGDNTNYKSIAINGGGMSTSALNNSITYYDNNAVVEYGNSSNTSSSNNNPSDTDSSDSSTSSTNTLFSYLSNLGTSIVKAIYGKDAYEALFGNNTVANDETYNNDATTESSSNVSSSSSSSTNYNNSSSTTSSTNYNNSSSTTSSTNNTGTSTMAKSYSTQQIWNALRSKGYSKAGTAGIMGNMNAESAYRANNMEDYYSNKLGITDQQYSDQVSNGTYPENKFVNDSIGYGLVQFTWNKLKQSLYNHTVKQGKRVDDMQSQINALSSQLGSSYSTLDNYLKTTNDVAGASDKFLVQYENPAQKNYETRRNYSYAAYNTYADEKKPTVTKNTNSNSSKNSKGGNIKTQAVTYGNARTKPDNTITTSIIDKSGISKTRNISDSVSNDIKKKISTSSTDTTDYAGIATKALNAINSSIGTLKDNASNNSIVSTNTPTIDYTTFLKTIVEILVNISNNTAMLSKVLEILSSKYDINIDPDEIKKTNNTNRAQAERALNDLLNKSSNKSSYAKLMNTKDTQYLVSAMAAIASE